MTELGRCERCGCELDEVGAQVCDRCADEVGYEGYMEEGPASD